MAAANTSTATSSSAGGQGRQAQMNKDLMQAATSGDYTSMKAMVASQDPSILLGTTPSGNTCLHISSIHGHQQFCKDVITLDESLLTAVNSDMETPLVIAVTLGHTSLASVLLGRCHELGLRQTILQQDQYGFSALHHAIRNGHKDLALELIAAEPALSLGVSKCNESPMFTAVMRGFTEVFENLVEIPDSAHVGQHGHNVLHALLDSAAYRGQVHVARELLKHCPDAPYRRADGWTCLHTAVCNDHAEYVEFILRTPQLRKLVNMQDKDGKTALHYAVQSCNSKIVVGLLSHQDINAAVLDNGAVSAAWELWKTTYHAKTLNWNEVCMLMLKADPQNAASIYNLHKDAKQQAINASRNDAKSLTQTYTSNTSLVAILIATITFAAAFTLPGGYSSDAGNEGLPIMSKKFAFQAFLISDVVAMCSSFAVAFICIIARWEDYEFLIYYRSFTKKLMWFAYVATTTAFSTGLYTVMAPRLRWLAIATCILVALLPILTKLLGEWPVLKLRFRLGKTYKSDLLEMV